jgi:Arm DNA-binding domain
LPHLTSGSSPDHHPSGIPKIATDPGVAAREWYFRYRLHGANTLIKLGEYPSLSLAEARAKAAERASLVRSGASPKEKIREDAERAAIEREKARRAVEREARKGSFGHLLDAYVEALRKRGKSSAANVEALFARAVRLPFPDLTAKKANETEPGEVARILARMVRMGVTRDVNKRRVHSRMARSEFIGHARLSDPMNLRRAPIASGARTLGSDRRRVDCPRV